MDGYEADAEQVGVATALERTCALEARLRQAIQDTHAFSSSFGHEAQVADRERDALTAVTDQLELLEEKLREYRSLDRHNNEDKTVVLSQLESLRRELITISTNSLHHVFFAKDVVREVQAFADTQQDEESASDEGSADGSAALPHCASNSDSADSSGTPYRMILHVAPNTQIGDRKTLDAQLDDALDFNDHKEASTCHKQRRNGSAGAAPAVASHQALVEGFPVLSAADSILTGSAGRSSAQRLAAWSPGYAGSDASSSARHHDASQTQTLRQVFGARTPRRASVEARPAVSSSESSSSDPHSGGRLEVHGFSSRDPAGSSAAAPPHSSASKPRFHAAQSRVEDDLSSAAEILDSRPDLQRSKHSSTLSSLLSAVLGAALGGGMVLLLGANESGSPGVRWRQQKPEQLGVSVPPPQEDEVWADSDVVLPPLPTLPFPDVNLGRG